MFIKGVVDSDSSDSVVCSAFCTFYYPHVIVNSYSRNEIPFEKRKENSRRVKGEEQCIQRD